MQHGMAFIYDDCDNARLELVKYNANSIIDASSGEVLLSTDSGLADTLRIVWVTDYDPSYVYLPHPNLNDPAFNTWLETHHIKRDTSPHNADVYRYVGNNCALVEMICRFWNCKVSLLEHITKSAWLGRFVENRVGAQEN